LLERRINLFQDILRIDNTTPVYTVKALWNDVESKYDISRAQIILGWFILKRRMDLLQWKHLVISDLFLRILNYSAQFRKVISMYKPIYMYYGLQYRQSLCDMMHIDIKPVKIITPKKQVYITPSLFSIGPGDEEEVNPRVFPTIVYHPEEDMFTMVNDIILTEDEINKLQDDIVIHPFEFTGMENFNTIFEIIDALAS